MMMHASCRGKGVASRLLTVVEEWAKGKGYRYIHLGTLKENHLYIPMYKKNGFQQIGEKVFDIAENLGMEGPINQSKLQFLKSTLF
jgi:GNAT superfamily N-acetyltransferase